MIQLSKPILSLFTQNIPSDIFIIPCDISISSKPLESRGLDQHVMRPNAMREQSDMLKGIYEGSRIREEPS